MFELAEIEKWNNTFLDGTIEMSDLKRPTELFVTRILVAYLRKFGYKVEPPFSLTVVEREETTEKCLFLARLTRKIDRILKITDKSYTFTYFDVIKPVPKRTARMLLILLNYYHYYTMFLADVYNIEQNALEKREELQRNIEMLRRVNTEQKDAALQMQDEIAKLGKVLPVTMAEIAEYQMSVEQSEAERDQIANDVEQLAQKCADLQARELALESQIVAEDEILAMKNEFSDVQNNIAVLIALEQNKQFGSNDRIERLQAGEQTFKSSVEMQYSLHSEEIDRCKATMKKLKKTKAQNEKITHEVDALQNSLEKLNADITAAQEALKKKKRNMGQEKRDVKRMLAENLSKLFEYQREQLSLKNRVEHFQNLLDEQVNIKECMSEIIAAIMEKYQA